MYSLSNFQLAFFAENDELTLKWRWKYKGPGRAKQLWKGKHSWKTYIFRLQRLQKSSVIKTVYWHKDRHLDQWNTIKNQEINPYVYGQVTFNKRATTIQWKNEWHFQPMVWGNWISTCQEWSWTLSFLHNIQKFIKMSRDPNVTAKTIQLLEGNIGVDLCDLGLAKHEGQKDK